MVEVCLLTESNGRNAIIQMFAFALVLISETAFFLEVSLPEWIITTGDVKK